MATRPKYPGIRITTNGNQLVSYYTEARITDGGIFYPITPSTEMGENYQMSYAQGKLNVFGQSKIAVETEGEHAAQGGAIAFSVTGKRTVNFTSGQGILYGLEQYYHAPGKLSTMVLEVASRALTKHALNVHCGHDDINAALDTGWIMLFAKDAQQAADQAVILRRVTELALNPGMNIQDGFLTSHLERSFYMHEAELLREFLGSPDDIIDTPTEAQRVLFGPKRRRVPEIIDLKNPTLIGPVQNQEHYMNGVIARRNNFTEEILPFLEESYKLFGELTGRYYGLISEYNTENADTVFVSLGSSAENIEAAVDYLKAERGVDVGVIHVNVIRPFPEAAIVNALKGKKNVIVLERTDEPMAGNNPLTRDIRTALSKALAHEDGLPAISAEEMPRIFNGSYGLGSRDFRPEHILGAYEYSQNEIARQDGKKASDNVSYFVLGIDHPYAVKSERTPSLLPENSIAVRFHSIGGWGMITTGKNLGSIIGDFGEYIAKKDGAVDEYGRLVEKIHVSANPKYGSEKKGAPTSYFLVVAPERVRVNCDLKHVNVVLCPDPKAFLHTNPLDGLVEGGVFVWESDLDPKSAWEHIPRQYRQEIIDKKIKLYTLPGFKIAREATDRPDLQMRMQGNSFLGAFFNVSPFLETYGIKREHFHEVVRAQYEKKFGRFGQKVVESNMTVMTKGYEMLTPIPYGDVDAPDRSGMRGNPLHPLVKNPNQLGSIPFPVKQPPRAPMCTTACFNDEFRAGYGYNQPATPLASVGLVSAATGATASKYVSRRKVPVFNAENCIQCMECITVCPDTALPNTAQEISTILETSIRHYVSDATERQKLLDLLPEFEPAVRAKMNEAVKSKQPVPFKDIVREEVGRLDAISDNSKEELFKIVDLIPAAYYKTKTIFSSKEKKEPGSGGIFSIFVSDLCKGCGECVVACGNNNALTMVDDSEVLNERMISATDFLNLLPETPKKYLGLYDNEHPEDTRTAVLRNHLMIRSNYQAFVAGDGACAGCGEKSVLRSAVSITEAYMRPMYHRKADRLDKTAARLREEGLAKLRDLKANHKEAYDVFYKTIAQLFMGLGGENDEDFNNRLQQHGEISDEELIDALATILSQDAFNHRDLQSVDGRLDNGMSVMAMGAHTGCNSVYGSTPPNNPHPYPWMNSLFQDGTTVGWLFGESFIVNHARRSVIPERLANALLDGNTSALSEEAYFRYTHFSDQFMTDQEIKELPKVWCVGGDGGMGDIGFQNVSKVTLQNRPNVSILVLDTQVYSNTGGQNSDSSPMPGGFDMNQIGAATQGKLTEKKNLAEILTSGHGSPFVAQVSMANVTKMYKAMLDGLEYRGVSVFQCFTSCQPEHGIGDDMSATQAQRIRDSRGVPEFVFNPSLGELYHEAMTLKGNPDIDKDWYQIRSKLTKRRYNYTVAHWAITEARFRNHFKKIDEEASKSLIPLDDMLLRITQNDVTYRRFLDPEHRAYVPDFGVFIITEDDNGKLHYHAISRHMVLFCVERRKAWRVLQSKAAIKNIDYLVQKDILKRVDSGELSKEELFNNSEALRKEAYERLK